MEKATEELYSNYAELINLIRHRIGEHEMPITLDTLIENDLGVSGEDASDLIIELSKRFKFSIEKFNFSKYFNDEPSIFNTGRFVHPFTIRHLIKAIMAGRLDEEVINN